MKSEKVIESYRRVTNEIGSRFYPVQKYFWLFGLIVSTILVIWYRGVNPTFLPDSFQGWQIGFVLIDFTVFSAIFTVGASGFALGVIFGVFLMPKIRETDWKSVLIDKFVTKRKTVYTNLSDEQFARMVGNEIEKIMKKYGVIPDKPVSTGLNMANEGYQELKNELETEKKKRRSIELDLQSATAEIEKLKKKLGGY